MLSMHVNSIRLVLVKGRQVTSETAWLCSMHWPSKTVSNPFSAGRWPPTASGASSGSAEQWGRGPTSASAAAASGYEDVGMQLEELWNTLGESTDPRQCAHTCMRFFMAIV